MAHARTEVCVSTARRGEYNSNDFFKYIIEILKYRIDKKPLLTPPW